MSLLHAARWLPWMSVLVACTPRSSGDLGAPSGDSAADSGEPGGQDTGAEAVDLPAQVERLYLAAHMPQQLPMLTYGLSYYSDEGCPIVTQTDDELVLTGDCTWSQGELQGSVSFSDTAVVWRDWSMSFGDGTVVAVSGAQQLGDTGSLRSDLVVIADVVDVPILPGGRGTYTYTDYLVTDWAAYLGDPEAPAGSSELLGAMAIEEVDAFDVAGSFSDDGQCSAYMDSVSMTLGGQELQVEYSVTPEPCDTCVDWVVEGQQSGTFCLGG